MMTIRTKNLKKHLQKVHKLNFVSPHGCKGCGDRNVLIDDITKHINCLPATPALKSPPVTGTTWQFVSRDRVVCPMCRSTEIRGRVVDLEQHVLKVHGQEAHTLLTIGENLLGCSGCGQQRVSLVNVGEHRKCGQQQTNKSSGSMERRSGSNSYLGHKVVKRPDSNYYFGHFPSSWNY